MSTETIIRCDVCDKVKGESNHWWKVDRNTALVGQGLGELIITDRSTESTSRDCCGHACVCQLVARFLDHGTLEQSR